MGWSAGIFFFYLLFHDVIHNYNFSLIINKSPYGLSLTKLTFLKTPFSYLDPILSYYKATQIGALFTILNLT